MVYIPIVYYQETIMTFLVGLHLYMWVLAVVFLDIQIQLTTDGMWTIAIFATVALSMHH